MLTWSWVVIDCRNHGCNRLNCVLCKHNPNKRCRGNFAHKYWVGDRLLAKCDGEIQVELINIDTQQTVSDGLQDACIEVRQPCKPLKWRLRRRTYLTQCGKYLRRMSVGLYGQVSLEPVQTQVLR